MEYPTPEFAGHQQNNGVAHGHTIEQSVRKTKMVQQMVVPQTIVQVAVVVPNEHQNHAQQEFAVVEGQSEHLDQLQFGSRGLRIFLGAGLHPHVDQHKNKRKVAQRQNELILIRRTGQSIRQYAAEQQNRAGKDGGEGLIVNDVASALFVVSGIEAVEPRRQARAEQGVNRVRQEQNDHEPEKPCVRVCDELRHQVGGDDIHGIEVDFRRQQNTLFLFEMVKDGGRKDAETAGNKGDKGHDAHAGDGHSIHGEKAGVKNTRDKDVVERGHQRTAQADQTAFAFFVAKSVDLTEREFQRFQSGNFSNTHQTSPLAGNSLGVF